MGMCDFDRGRFSFGLIVHDHCRLFIDYRHFDQVSSWKLFALSYFKQGKLQANITPRFEFGFGLSYTTFSYSGLGVLTIQSLDLDQQDLITAWKNGQASPIAEGSSTALWCDF